MEGEGPKIGDGAKIKFFFFGEIYVLLGCASIMIYSGMRHIKLFESFFTGYDNKLKHFVLDGASSAGKSSALLDLDSDWSVLAVDSFYNVMFEELREEDFGNGNKPTISEIYPGCPYSYSGPNEPNFEKAARWYMSQEARSGKIFQIGLKDATGNEFGKPMDKTKVIYDDVEGGVIDMFKNENKPKWLLIHAPIDHTIKNVNRRGDRPLDGVLKNSYCFKYYAKPNPGGVDPNMSWSADDIRALLPSEEWVEEFLTKLGVYDDGRRYWIYTKPQPQGKYDVIINTRDGRGNQKSIEQIAKEAKIKFDQ